MLLPFQRPTLADRPVLEPLFHKSGYRSCEYSFANLLAWAEAYDERAAVIDGFAVVWVGAEGGNYLWPAGEGDLRTLLVKLYRDSVERHSPFTLVGLTKEQCDQLEGWFPGKFSYENPEDGADYCYTAEKLASLAGKKLHAKRNHIHRFEERFPNWHTEPLSAANEDACRRIDRDWEREEAEAGLEDWHSDQGEIALELTLRNREALGMDGLVLYTGPWVDEDGVSQPDRPVAFCMGQTLGGDTYDVLFEKAYGEVQGTYAMINREFARWVLANIPGVVYLNREDDLGEPNLRKAKRSYYPDLMVEKWNARLHDNETLEEETMNCRIAAAGEEPLLKELWQRCFQEEPEMIDALFQRLYRPGRGLVLEADGVIRSMLLAIPVQILDSKRNSRPATYIYAFCTHPEARGKGYGRTLLRWAEEQAAARGDCAVIMVPGEPSLFAYYEALGYTRVSPHGEVSLSAVPETAAGTVEQLTPEEYGELREELLANIPHVAYDLSLLEGQEALCTRSGGELYAVTLGVVRCAAAAECWPGEPVHIKELIAPKALQHSVAAVLCRALGREDCIYHAPAPEAEDWCVAKWLSGEPLPELWFGIGLD